VTELIRRYPGSSSQFASLLAGLVRKTYTPKGEVYPTGSHPSLDVCLSDRLCVQAFQLSRHLHDANPHAHVSGGSALTGPALRPPIAADRDERHAATPNLLSLKW